MPTLVLDMPSGIAGDMLLAALIGCGADAGAISAALDGLGLGSFGILAEAVDVGHGDPLWGGRLARLWRRPSQAASPA